MASFLQDSNGNYSSTRLIGSLWYMGVLLAVGYLVAKNGTIPDVPTSIMTILATVATWLVANKHIETSVPKAQNAPTQP